MRHTRQDEFDRDVEKTIRNLSAGESFDIDRFNAKWKGEHLFLLIRGLPDSLFQDARAAGLIPPGYQTPDQVPTP